MLKKFDTLGYTSKDVVLRGNYKGIITENIPFWNRKLKFLHKNSIFCTWIVR